jgi:hypothetical protein
MIRTQDKRTWAIGGIVAATVLTAAGWFLVLSPVLSDTTSIRSQTSATNHDNQSIQAKADDLARQHRNVGHLAAQLRHALSELPIDNGLPALTRQLSRQAKATGVRLTGVTVGSIAPVANAAAAPDPTVPSTTPADTTATAAATPAADALVSIQITVSSTGSAANQLAFLHAIQVDGPRRTLVTSTELGTASDRAAGSIEDACTMTAALTVFSAPRSAAEQAQLEKLLRAK